MITVDDILNSSFIPTYKKINWIESDETNDTGLYLHSEDDAHIIKSALYSNYSSLVYNGSTFEDGDIEYSIDNIALSPNLEYSLIRTNSTVDEDSQRYAIYWVYDIENESFTQITDDLIAVAKWSPKSDKIAFISSYNVYVYFIDTDDSDQVTDDGNSTLLNGETDLYYKGTIGNDALWWSPSGDYLAYLKLNNSEVPEYPLVYYVSDDEEYVNSSYPKLVQQKYPNAGAPITIPSLYIYSLDSQDNLEVEYSDDVFSSVLWVGDDELLLKSLNRESDNLKVIIIDANDASFNLTRNETTNGWFELNTRVSYIPTSDSVNETGYVDAILYDGYTHLGYFSPPSNSTPKLLTSGSYEVINAPSAIDLSKNLVYYISNENAANERHLYSVDFLTGNITALTKDEGYYDASFSVGARFALVTNYGPNIPYQSLVDFYTSNVELIETNDELAEFLKDYDLPIKTWGTVEISDNVTAYYEEIKPADFDETKQYPVLFYPYGGPGSLQSDKVFELSFTEVMVSQLDIIVVKVDGRGTSFQGTAFNSIVKGDLGYYQSIDQISAGKLWAEKDYVDESNMGIWGWSFGGFLTLKTLERDAGETFQYGMSVAPVTDWRYYQATYTDRYMGLPENNEEGYTNSSTLYDVDALANVTRFLLMHGTGDDNVHVQNSFVLLDKLDLASVTNYDSHIFPDSDHNIKYHNANYVIYNQLVDWIARAFDGTYLNF